MTTRSAVPRAADRPEMEDCPWLMELLLLDLRTASDDGVNMVMLWLGVQ